MAAVDVRYLLGTAGQASSGTHGPENVNFKTHSQGWSRLVFVGTLKGAAFPPVALVLTL